MRVHAAPMNITFPNKLRRLPHIFDTVLQLPFHSDADVLVHETYDSFRFVVTTDDNFGDDIRVHSVQIHPGITRIVVLGAGNGNVLDLSVDELELDAWRFRLPAVTRPEHASAACSDGELVVVVPKGDEEEIWGERNGRLVLVQ